MSLAHERLEKLRRLRALEVAKRDELIAQAKADIANSEYRRMARSNQLPPDGEWRIWLLLCGRGFGKTWTGARYLIEKAQTIPGNYAVSGIMAAKGLLQIGCWNCHSDIYVSVV